MFSSEIYKTITANRIYKKKLEKKRNCITECILMIFTSKSSKRAYINLCLDLKRGLEIKDKLYN
jgi:hypothetical protein